MSSQHDDARTALNSMLMKMIETHKEVTPLITSLYQCQKMNDLIPLLPSMGKYKWILRKHTIDYTYAYKDLMKSISAMSNPDKAREQQAMHDFDATPVTIKDDISTRDTVSIKRINFGRINEFDRATRQAQSNIISNQKLQVDTPHKTIQHEQDQSESTLNLPSETNLQSPKLDYIASGHLKLDIEQINTHPVTNVDVIPYSTEESLEEQLPPALAMNTVAQRENRTETVSRKQDVPVEKRSHDSIEINNNSHTLQYDLKENIHDLQDNYGTPCRRSCTTYNKLSNNQKHLEFSDSLIKEQQLKGQIELVSKIVKDDSMSKYKSAWPPDSSPEPPPLEEQPTICTVSPIPIDLSVNDLSTRSRSSSASSSFQQHHIFLTPASTPSPLKGEEFMLHYDQSINQSINNYSLLQTKSFLHFDSITPFTLPRKTPPEPPWHDPGVSSVVMPIYPPYHIYHSTHISPPFKIDLPFKSSYNDSSCHSIVILPTHLSPSLASVRSQLVYLDTMSSLSVSSPPPKSGV